MQQNSRRQFIWTLAGTTAWACQDQAKVPQTPAGGGGSGGASRSSSGSVPMRELGKTGVRVSVLGLGGAHIGKSDKLSERESIALIRSAIDNGITFLDNCWDYNDGQSELRMGKALSDGYRQRVFLMTKIDGRTREAAAGQLEQSLARLQTDLIDLVQVHEVIRPTDPERCFAPGGTMEALIEARQAGKIRFIGFTGHKDPQIHLAMLAEAERHGFEFDTVQMPLNVMDHHYNSFEAHVLPVLLEKRIGVLGMKSMGSGDILDSQVVKPAECLRYALSLPTSVVICGMDSQRVLDENLQTARTFSALSPEERSSLLARTRDVARDGKHEPFKTSHKYDGTIQNPKWLEQAAL
jgi:aryl-alcohol dehydrogenase-like predicted oxidoreductase